MPRYFATMTRAAVLLGIAAVTFGCSETNSSIFVRQVNVPDVNDSCVVASDPESLHRTGGWVDYVVRPTGYDGALLIGNQLIRRAEPDTLRPETSRVQLYEAEVEVFDFNGNSLDSYTLPVSGFLEPANSSEPGYGSVSLTMISALALQQVAGSGAPAQTLVSRVKVYGVTLGNEEVETGSWDYPVFACPGCTPCIEPKTCDEERLLVCLPGQDDAVDCRDLGTSVCN